MDAARLCRLPGLFVIFNFKDIVVVIVVVVVGGGGGGCGVVAVMDR